MNKNLNYLRILRTNRFLKAVILKRSEESLFLHFPF